MQSEAFSVFIFASLQYICEAQSMQEHILSPKRKDWVPQHVSPSSHPSREKLRWSETSPVSERKSSTLVLITLSLLPGWSQGIRIGGLHPLPFWALVCHSFDRRGDNRQGSGFKRWISWGWVGVAQDELDLKGGGTSSQSLEEKPCGSEIVPCCQHVFFPSYSRTHTLG